MVKVLTQVSPTSRNREWSVNVTCCELVECWRWWVEAGEVEQVGKWKCALLCNSERKL